MSGEHEEMGDVGETGRDELWGEGCLDCQCKVYEYFDRLRRIDVRVMVLMDEL